MLETAPSKKAKAEHDRDDLFRPAFAAPEFTPLKTELVSDSIARQEAVAIASEVDLEKDGKEKEHGRHQIFRDHINKATILLFWTVSLGIFSGIATFCFHMITPDAWHYLSPSQLEKLQTMLGAAVLSSALTGYVNKRMT